MLVFSLVAVKKRFTSIFFWNYMYGFFSKTTKSPTAGLSGKSILAPGGGTVLVDLPQLNQLLSHKVSDFRKFYPYPFFLIKDSFGIQTKLNNKLLFQLNTIENAGLRLWELKKLNLVGLQNKPRIFLYWIKICILPT